MVVVPATFKLPMILTLLKLDGPDTLKDDIIVDAPETNKLVKFVLLFNLILLYYYYSYMIVLMLKMLKM